MSRLKFLLLIISLFHLLSCATAPPPPPTLPPPTGKPEGIYHTVNKNETLWRICKTYKVNIQEVAELNNIKNPSRIKVGDKIFITGAKKELPVTTTPKDKHPGQTITIKKGMFIWPLKGSIITQFGMNNGFKNDGIDIAASAGSTVVAAYDGKVVFSSQLKGYGNTIIIQHKEKYATVYASNQVNLAKSGDVVSKGQTIARAGNSGGQNTAPHLHFQIREKNQPRNPLFYLP